MNTNIPRDMTILEGSKKKGFPLSYRTVSMLTYNYGSLTVEDVCSLPIGVISRARMIGEKAMKEIVDMVVRAEPPADPHCHFCLGDLPVNSACTCR